jgi:hypothetical protein
VTAACRQGKVEQAHLNASEDTVFYLIQETAENSTSNLLDLLYFGHCRVLLFKVLNMPFKYVKFRNMGCF